MLVSIINNARPKQCPDVAQQRRQLPGHFGGPKWKPLRVFFTHTICGREFLMLISAALTAAAAKPVLLSSIGS